MAERDYFPMYHSYLEKTQRLSDQELGRLVRALLRYSITGEYQELKGRESMAFEFIAFDIDRAKDSWNAKSETYRQNRKGSKQLSTIDNNSQQLITIDNNCGQYNNEYDNEHDNNITPPVSPSRGKRFVPPTLEEVTAYCKDRNNGVDPEAFIAFYSSKGWKVGNQSMKDWKSAVITWEKRRKTEGRKQTEDELEEEIRRFLNDEE